MEKNTMKTFAKFLTGVTVVIVALLAYYIYSSNLALSVNVTIVPASERADDFDKIAMDVQAGDYENISALRSMEEYYFVTIDVSAKNFSPFPAEWAQFVPRPIEGDVIIASQDAGPKDIERFKEGRFSVTLLTTARETTRTGWLEYYVFGRFHSVEGIPSY